MSDDKCEECLCKLHIRLAFSLGVWTPGSHQVPSPCYIIWIWTNRNPIYVVGYRCVWVTAQLLTHIQLYTRTQCHVVVINFTITRKCCIFITCHAVDLFGLFPYWQWNKIQQCVYDLLKAHKCIKLVILFYNRRFNCSVSLFSSESDSLGLLSEASQ